MEEQTTTEANPTPEVAPQPVAQETVLGPSESDNQDWKSTLSEDLRNDPTLKNFKDVESLAKTVVHQQKQMGNRIPIPKTPEEHMEVYNKLGRPETADKYEVAVPETHTEYIGEDQINQFKNVAHNIGLNNEQVKQLIDFQVKNIDAQAQRYQTDIAVQKQHTEESLKKEWGHEYDINVRNARRALQVYGDPEITELMNGEAGNIPAVVKMFARLGKEVTEDMAQNTQNNNLATSPLDAQQEITDIMDDGEHPYHNGKHREHLQAVEHMRQLHEKVFGK
tara:strand:- start:2616 stop:3452 length:837 start_codon:yes stop_codon:yes gene_type:complete